MTDLFVSYKSEDRARVKPLVDALITDGVHVWWDAHIDGGDTWRESIELNLASAKCVLVVWSKRSTGVNGHFVRDEATRAQRRHAYLPVRIDAVEPPLGFGEIQAISLEGWRGKRDDPRYLSVLKAVRAIVEGRHPSYIGHGRAFVGAAPMRRRALIAGGVGALALAGFGGWAWLKPGAPFGAKRIAVLPFANMSGDPAQAYFSDGVAEELRSALSRIGLEVIGRASCEAVKDLDIKSASAKLGVLNVLTGSVRRSPSTIRVGAQLVGGADGVEKWAQNYDSAPGDTIRIQTDVAAQVAGALRIALGGAKRAALTLGGTASAKAQDLYLQAQALSRMVDGGDALRKNIALYDAALADDPDYGDALLSKASSLSIFATQYTTSSADQVKMLARARQSVERAATLMPGSGRPSAVAAQLSMFGLDFGNAVRGIEQALTADSADIFILRRALNILPALGSGVQALALADKMIALDPLSGGAFSSRGLCLYGLRRYADAIAAFDEGLMLAPLRNNWRVTAASCLILLGRSVEAQAMLAKAPANDSFRLAAEAILAARGGDRVGAEAVMAKMRAIDGDLDNYQYGQIYVQLGEADYALLAFDRAVEVFDPGLSYLRRDPFLDPIRGDPRFAALLKRLNFPETGDATAAAGNRVVTQT